MPRWRWQVGAALVVLVLLGLLARSLWSLTSTPHLTVGSYFDNPPAWPGPPWARSGVEVSKNVLEAAAGPEHCGWQSATLLTIGWPLGTEATNSSQARQYIRDPIGAMQSAFLKGTWARNSPLPLDVSDTGYRYGVLKLFLAPSDADRYVYVVAPKDSERWPRSDPMSLCE